MLSRFVRNRVGAVGPVGLFFAALCLVAVMPTGAAAQAVEGVLSDSEAGLPIAGATVVLLDGDNEAQLRVRTDARGRFRLTAPEPGVYTVVADRDGYASTVSDPVTLIADATLRLDLTISALRRPAPAPAGSSQQQAEDLDWAEDLDPFEAAQRFAAMVATACEGVYDPAAHAILVGVVRDSVSGVPLPAVDAVIEWEGVPDSTAQIRVAFDPGTGAPRTFNQLKGVTGDDGSYLICNAPASESLQLWAQAGDEASGDRRPLRLNAGMMAKEDLILGLTNQDQPGDLFGVVRDRTSGSPLVNAEVTIEGADLTTMTNERGVFTLENVPWGIYVLDVKYLGYADARQAFRVQGGRAHQLEVYMTEEAIELEPLTVSVRPRAWFDGITGLQHRMNLGFGFILDREELDRRGASNIDDALRGLPGVRIQQVGAYGSMVTFRNSRNMLSASCTPAIFMDGVKMRLDPELGLNEFTALDLEAIEVYRSAAEVPGEFGGLDSGCGALVFWTRRGLGR